MVKRIQYWDERQWVEQLVRAAISRASSSGLVLVSPGVFQDVGAIYIYIYGCGSKIDTQNGTLVNGNMD